MRSAPSRCRYDRSFGNSQQNARPAAGGVINGKSIASRGNRAALGKCASNRTGGCFIQNLECLTKIQPRPYCDGQMTSRNCSATRSYDQLVIPTPRCPSIKVNFKIGTRSQSDGWDIENPAG